MGLLTLRRPRRGALTASVGAFSGAGVNLAHTADCTFDLTFSWSSGGSDSLYLDFRMQDAANYWDLEVAGSGTVRLNRVVATVAAQVAATGGLVTGTQRLQLLVAGGRFRCYVNGALLWDYTDAALTFATVAGNAKGYVFGAANCTSAKSYAPPVRR